MVLRHCRDCQNFGLFSCFRVSNCWIYSRLVDGTMWGGGPHCARKADAVPRPRWDRKPGIFLRKPVFNLREFQKRLPLVWAAAWRSPDRRVAIAVTSISDQPLTASLELDAVAMGLAGLGNVYRIDERGRRLVGKYRADAPRLRLDLSPLDACILELKPD